MNTAKTLFLILFLSFIVGNQFTASAQISDIESEIRSHESEKELLIKGRYMLLDSLESGRTEKAGEVLDYLMGLSEDLLPFLPDEYFLILYWLNDYDNLYDELQTYLLNDGAEVDGIWQLEPTDLILPQLRRWTQNHEDQLRKKIDEHLEPGEKRNFLHLYLSQLLNRNNYSVESEWQKSLNADATEFLNKYPNSKWTRFVKNNIRYRYELSTWFLGFNFGGGYNGLTKDLKNRYGNSGSMDFELFFGYNRLGLALDAHIAFLRNKMAESFTFEDGFEVTWPEDAAARFYRFSLNAFSHIKLSNDFYAVPIAGIGLSSIGPTEEDMEDFPELEVFKTGYFETFNIGMGLQWRFKKNIEQYSSVFTGQYREQSNWYLQLRYVFSEPQFQRKLAGFEGQYHTVTLSIGGFGRGYRRKL